MPEKQEEAELLQSWLLPLLYMLRNRRCSPQSEASKRREDMERRRRLRQYYMQKHSRLLMLLIAHRRREGPFIHPCTWPSIRRSNWWEQVVMKEFGPRDWLERFRMSKDTFFYVCGQLQPKLCRHASHLQPSFSVEKKVAVALWRLATNTEYRVICFLFGMNQSMVHKCVKAVCQAIVSLLKPLYLQQPKEQELDNMARIFNARWGFPHCIGALGSLHVALTVPSQCSTDYRNSRCWHSVVLQATVDGLGKFWDLCAGFPGSMENSIILQNSYLWELVREGSLFPEPPRPFLGVPLKYVLLGDASYPLQDWLLKPYKEHQNLTQQQLKFNYRLERAHSVIENAFLRLRARWQCLLTHNDCLVELVPTMILACCILHNVCQVHNEKFVDKWLEAIETSKFPQPSHPMCESMDDSTAETVRELISEYFTSHDEC
ncbi:protein ANTAGONIST OF LIKE HETEROCHROMATIN PROTEIN 1 [Microcaecilia unicolor]|uniref:Protein ANTAGONIST OF LIKE HETEROCHROMATIN PROTEIN 1-like n=1 Tax=Microcaecilia unicolor TaxID=1415580 RepID=A0A6P7ZE78_9AMPH|nr:protein ANTAGONIST OF LIKE HETEROCHROMATIN PROTEIN 1-like [Microcaecilia unicolor]